METKISLQRLRELEKNEKILRALEAGGVQNWEFYEDSLAELMKEEEIEDIIESTLSDIEVALLNGAYEPSERGAGYCASDKGREEAYETFRNGVKKILEIKKQ